jgi:excisionase family DNA binding protein
MTEKPHMTSMSRKEVAELFQVSPSTVTRWAREGRIPALRTPGGHYRYPAAAMRRLAGLPRQGELLRLD